MTYGPVGRVSVFNGQIPMITEAVTGSIGISDGLECRTLEMSVDSSTRCLKSGWVMCGVGRKRPFRGDSVPRILLVGPL